MHFAVGGKKPIFAEVFQFTYLKPVTSKAQRLSIEPYPIPLSVLKLLAYEVLPIINAAN